MSEKTITGNGNITINATDPSDANAVSQVVKQAKYASELCDKRLGTAIQAGGHKGAAPLQLIKYFDLVYTYEPCIDNFKILVSKISGNIIPMFGLLYDRHGRGGIEQHDKNNSGDYRTTDFGKIPRYRIDDLNLKSCDLIWLDTQGSEYEIILGAQQTIERCKPIIGFEDCPTKCPQTHDLDLHLKSLGYEFIKAVNLDRFYR